MLMGFLAVMLPKEIQPVHARPLHWRHIEIWFDSGDETACAAAVVLSMKAQ